MAIAVFANLLIGSMDLVATNEISQIGGATTWRHSDDEWGNCHYSTILIDSKSSAPCAPRMLGDHNCACHNWRPRACHMLTMETNLLPNRIGVSDTEFQAAFEALQKHFPLPWLSHASGNHPLQELWRRRDGLAIGELYTLGVSIQRLSKIDEPWVVRQLSHVRAPDENNRKGALFELLAGALFCTTNQNVKLAPRDTRGYDLDVASNEKSWRISLKTFATSTHEVTFRKRMKVLKQMMDEPSLRMPHTQWLIAANSWPTEADWQWLHSAVRGQLSRGHPVSMRGSCWEITAMPLPAQQQQAFASGRSSYTLLGLAPHHANEQRNFVSKLQSAVANLEHHVRAQPETYPVVMMRVPPTADVVSLRSWARSYFEETPESPLQALWLLQPYIASDPAGATSWIAYHFGSELCPQYADSRPPTLNLDIPLGKVSISPPTWTVSGTPTAVRGRYVYQAGRHYIEMSETPSGGTATLTRSAPGIQTRLLMGNSVIAGRWGEDLMLVGD